MSHVTDIILVTAIDDYGVSELSTNLFKADIFNPGQSFMRVDHLTEGSRVMQCDVFLTAMTHFGIDELLKEFYKINWDYPDYVQLMIKDGEETVFTLHTPPYIPLL